MHSARRALVYPVVLVASLAVATTVVAAPAFADTIGITPTTWAYTDSAAPGTRFTNPESDAPVGTRTGADGATHTYRSYFTYDLAGLRDQVVRWAWISTTEQAVDNCETPTPIELWRTEPIPSDLTWRNQPAELELVHRFERGGPGCPSYLGWNVLTMVTAALARHETVITLELRIATDTESSVGNARTLRLPLLGLTANYPPTVDGLQIGNRVNGCGTPADHPSGNDWTVFQAKVADRDSISVNTTFVAWPIDHPDQRKEIAIKFGVGDVSATAELSRFFADGTELAWSARAKDQDDASSWAAPCYLTVDRTPPSSRPAVSSQTYPQSGVASGGPGVAGQFRFDANGDREVYGFEYTDGSGVYHRVPANQPGGWAVIEYTPSQVGWPVHLDVLSYDEAGNRGPATNYEFIVRDTAPHGSVDVAGVGLPSAITLSSWATEVTEFGFQLDGQPEVRISAVGGTGTAEVTFTRTGLFQVQVRSYSGTTMIGAGTLSIRVDDSPLIRSDEFGVDHDVIIGTSGTFTFKPRTAGVVAYEADFGDGSDVQRIDAAADGSAVLRWTPTKSDWYQLTVVSIQADGSRSQSTYFYVSVTDSGPTES